MKKMLSLALALMLLMLCPAMAETAEVAAPAVQTLTAPDGTYSFDVPEDFIPMNSFTMKMLFSTEEMQNAIAQAMGLADASQLEVYFEQLEASNMMIVYGPDMLANMNTQAIATELTMDILVLLKDVMDESTTQQYVNLGIAEEDIHPMEIQEIGSYRWYGMQVKMMGLDIQTMMTIENGVQYVLTFTGMDAATMESILTSFKVEAPAAQ